MPCKDWDFYQEVLIKLMFLICRYGLCFAYRQEVQPLWTLPTASPGLQWRPRTRIYAGRFALSQSWSVFMLLQSDHVLKERKRSRERLNCQSMSGQTLPSILILPFCFLTFLLVPPTCLFVIFLHLFSNACCMYLYVRFLSSHLCFCTSLSVPSLSSPL